jgi:cytochrome b561
VRWRGDNNHWSTLSIALHWLTALVVLGQFALGLWMTDLTLYDHWYHQAPTLHKAIGVLLFLLVLLRLWWRLFNGRPQELAEHQPWERFVAKWTHRALYLLLFAVMVSGYLISTADGRGVSVFGWFTVPATLHGIDGQEDVAGVVHLTLASTLVAVALLHAGAAFKHHFIDRDRTLKRMLGM